WRSAPHLSARAAYDSGARRRTPDRWRALFRPVRAACALLGTRRMREPFTWKSAIVCAAAVSLLAACSGPSSEALGASRAADSTAFPNDRPTYHYFRVAGFTNFQAAAIVGNLDQESGIDPTISQQNGGPG